MFKKFAILGEMGSGNLGDDLGYILLKKEIEKHFEYIQIDWLTPSRFSQLDYMGYDCVITGCGTLLDRAGGEYMLALHRVQERHIPTAILGSGLSDPDHVPDNDFGSQLYDKVIGNSAYVWLRGDAPDVMWLLGWKYTGAAQNDYGINMGFAGYTRANLYDLRNRIAFIEELWRSQGKKVKHVSCWKNDNPWMKGTDLLVTGNPASFEELSRYRALVAFRGHMGVVAACCNVNVLAVTYSSKIEKMYDGTGVAVTYLSPDNKNWGDVVEEAMNKTVNNEGAVKDAQVKVQNKIKEFVERFQ